MQIIGLQLAWQLAPDLAYVSASPLALCPETLGYGLPSVFP